MRVWKSSGTRKRFKRARKRPLRKTGYRKYVGLSGLWGEPDRPVFVRGAYSHVIWIYKKINESEVEEMKRVIREGFDLGSAKLVLQVAVISDGIEQQKLNRLSGDIVNSYHGLFVEESGQGGGVFGWQQDSHLR